MPDPTTISTPDLTVESRGFNYRHALVVGLALFVIFFQLGSRGLNEPDEGRYAEVGREMAASNDFLTPRLNGNEHLSKPPMTYWLIALSIKLLGTNEWAARLPAALGALGTLLAVYLLTRSTFDETTALWAAVILLSCIEFFTIARVITTDMLLTCWVTWSVWSFWRWHQSPDRSWRKIAWFYVFLAVGMITKGPLAMILPLFAVVGLGWKNPNLKLNQLRLGWGIGMFFAIAAPWFLAVAGTDPAHWHYFLFRETVERLTSATHHRGGDWWYFLPVLAGGFLPWTTLLPGAIWILRKEGGDRILLLRACLTWVGFGFLLFSASQSKLPTYILPLFPPLAIVIAASLKQMFQDRKLSLAPLLGVLIFCGGLAIAVHLLPPKYEWIHKTLMTGSGLALILAALCLQFLKRIPEILGLLLSATIALELYAVTILPSMDTQLRHNSTVKPFALRIQHEDPTQKNDVICVYTFPRALPFYLKRLVYRSKLTETKKNLNSYPVFEFDSMKGPMDLEPQELQKRLGGSQRVFCIATERTISEMQNQFNLKLYKLEQIASWVLVSNQSSP